MADKTRIPLLSAEGLKKYYTAKSGMFSRSAGVVRAVDGVSFQLFEGETLGLVGESGCGKSTLGRQLVGLEHPTGGRVIYDGKDLGNMSQAQMKPFRTQLQMIFQDSYSSLNPRKHVFEILAEPMLYHGLADVYKRQALAWVLRRKEVTTVLIGASSTAQLEDNAKALDSPAFSCEELADIEGILKG